MGGFSVAAIDVGALGNIGWWHYSASGETTSGRDLDSLVEVVVADLGWNTGGKREEPALPDRPKTLDSVGGGGRI